MADEQPFHFTVTVGMSEAQPDELDDLARQLNEALQEQPVESAQMASAGSAPQGTKAGEAFTLGAVAVAVLPALLPKVVEFIQAWALRGQGRTVKFEGAVAGQTVKFEGRAEDLQKILAQLAAGSPSSA
ncbi:MAG: hypothetical protein L0Z70_01765 [Chloroflexi bacterium]|nr:hypothetical protein [Chloroflexota bacterium]